MIEVGSKLRRLGMIFGLASAAMLGACATSRPIPDRFTELYNRDGLSFRYPDTMEVRSLGQRGQMRAVVAEYLTLTGRGTPPGPHAFVLVAVPPRRSDPYRAQAAIYRAMRSWASRVGFVDESETGQRISRVVAGQPAPGVRVVSQRYQVGLVTEIFSAHVGASPVLLIFGYPEGEAEQDVRMFDVIARSLSVAPPPAD